MPVSIRLSLPLQVFALQILIFIFYGCGMQIELLFSIKLDCTRTDTHFKIFLALFCTLLLFKTQRMASVTLIKTSTGALLMAIPDLEYIFLLFTFQTWRENTKTYSPILLHFSLSHFLPFSYPSSLSSLPPQFSAPAQRQRDFDVVPDNGQFG